MHYHVSHHSIIIRSIYDFFSSQLKCKYTFLLKRPAVWHSSHINYSHVSILLAHYFINYIRMMDYLIHFPLLPSSNSPVSHFPQFTKCHQFCFKTCITVLFGLQFENTYEISISFHTVETTNCKSTTANADMKSQNTITLFLTSHN